MDENLADIMQRARAGDPRALSTWGRMLVTGAPGVPITLAGMHEGVACLRDADAKGDPEAPNVLATMAAFGILRSPNLSEALRLLESSAARGWELAQQQLSVLGGRDALVRISQRQVLRDHPRLRVFENFATPAECDWMIDRTRAQLQRAEIHPAGHELVVDDIRTNSECFLMPRLLDVVAGVVLQRIATVMGLNLSFFEFATVLHYQPGQLFGPHTDFFDPSQPGKRAEIAARGQRIATMLVYLNEEYEAGETEFLDAHIKYKGRKGDALMFVNVEPNGDPDYGSTHQGSPPASGEKWVLSQWARGRALNAYLTPGGENARLPENWLRDA